MKRNETRERSSEPWPSPVLGWFAVAVLTLAYIVSFIDRTILALLVEPIKMDLGLSDTQVGVLGGFAFAIFYTLMGLPIAWLADRWRRNIIIAAGILLWSLMTAACGLARSFWALFAARVGVGVGEAALSPPAYSMLADYFPPQHLGKPIGVYSSGVFIGAGLAFLIGGVVVQFFVDSPPMALPLVGELRAWQLAFIAVGLPGILVAGLMLLVPEPERRGSLREAESADFRAMGRWAAPRRRALLCHMFAFGFISMPVQAIFVWMPSYLIRQFEFNPGQAGTALGTIAIIFGPLGMVTGGWLSDRLKQRGYHDAPLRVGLWCAVLGLPFVASFGLVDSWFLSLCLLAPVIYLSTCAVGTAPTGLQLITPNQYRARVGAMFMLVFNLIGTGAAPALTALATDYLFQDTSAVGRSMVLVSTLAMPLAAGVFYFGLKPFREASDPLAMS